MSNTSASLRAQIGSAEDLRSVARTMKALAASSIGQYEKSVRALTDYYRTVEFGLGACFRQGDPAPPLAEWTGRNAPVAIGAVVFGSDQGLVGQFNEAIVDYAVESLKSITGTLRVWAVGERARSRLADAGLPPLGQFDVPNSVQAIAPLVGQILVQCEADSGGAELKELHLFHNRPAPGAVYAPIRQRLLPLDEIWRCKLAKRPWPTGNLPEVMGTGAVTLRALIREYLFISIFQACAESLAGEHASRLAAMERAERNINDLLENLHGTFHRMRQSAIDEELFDVIAGFEALTKGKASFAAR
jgi:F-type H+-transporting ATPase subunit gamma